jgi:hypothetical protein
VLYEIGCFESSIEKSLMVLNWRSIHYCNMVGRELEFKECGIGWKRGTTTLERGFFFAFFEVLSGLVGFECGLGGWGFNPAKPGNCTI